MSNRFIDQLIGRKRYMKAEKFIEKYGNVTIFVFNALPLSSPSSPWQPECSGTG